MDDPVNPEHAQQTLPGIALFNLGFRPFFAGAAIWSLLSIVVWSAMYSFQLPLTLSGNIPVPLWHAHEMIYGYALAVIAGFLLTAAKNWTNIQTTSGVRLLLLFMLWLTARVSLLAGGMTAFYLAAVADMLFVTTLAICIVLPIVKVRQWRQISIVSKLVLLGTGNVLFYLGALGVVDGGMRIAVYGGLYLVIGLILTMGRRVIPGFIERGVDYPVQLRNSRWLDLGSLSLFLVFFIVHVFTRHQTLAVWLAGMLFVLHCIRMLWWHTPGIWRKPLLWSLYVSYAFINLGFLMFFLGGVAGISPLLAVHAFSYGAIGMITLSMMARVSLGHTGRSVIEPPRLINLSFVFLAVGTVIRVILPAVSMQQYLTWILLSQIAWVIAYGIFLIVFLPVLLRPRIDGRFA